MPFIVVLLLLVFLLLILGYLISLFFESSQKRSLLGGFESVLFLVMMPSQSPKKDGDIAKDEKVLISQMEQVLLNFVQLKTVKLFGSPPTVALEIASQTGGSDISFYVSVPKNLDSVFEKYVQGVYPKAIVKKVPEDYTVFEPKGEVAGAYLKLKDNFLFPISTYQKLEKDPISQITNNLSKIKPDEGAAIQLIIRPLFGFDVKKRGQKALKKIREGKDVKTAVYQANQGALADFFAETAKSNETKEQKEKEMESRGKEQGYDQLGYEAITSKIQKQSFQVNIRLISCAKSKERADEILSHLTSSFSQFSLSLQNSFTANEQKNKKLKKFIFDFVFRNFNEHQGNILNVEEIASIYHFPTHLTETPYIKSSKSNEAPPPSELPNEGVVLLGHVPFRGEDKKVYFPSKQDRRRHFYIIGQTGTGKSALMQEMIRQDIENGEGVAVIDPHGELIEHTLSIIPKSRVDDVVLFEPFDQERPIGLNMLEYDTPEQKDFAVQEMISIFYKLFPPEIIGPMFEHYMRNAMLALMADKDNPGTLVEIPKMFTDPAFLQERLSKVSDVVVRNFWTKEWAQTTGSTKSDMLGYVVSKVGRFIENEMMRNIIGQGHSGFDLSKIMDEKKIFLANLSKGLTGEVNSSLLGLILVSKIQMAAMRRARLKEEDRQDFYLYVDEFQNFTTDSIGTILSEARKYKLNLIIAHQFIPQLQEPIRNAVMGNVGSMGAFRVGAEDAEFLEKQFEPNFSRFDLVNLDNFNLVVKMMINNKTSSSFSMQTYAPKEGRSQIIDPIKKISKLKCGKPKAIVEKDIAKRSFASVVVSEKSEKLK
ncbi:MAG: DUF87 domain-containing protein [Candidatus Staskawiczbacteria bacterium]|nr:DUF87 domain-containing protein [Candidatus Staskawiczbacteria bacterium]